MEVGEAVADFSIFLRLSRCKERAIREVGQNTAEPKTTLYNINKNYTWVKKFNLYFTALPIHKIDRENIQTLW